MAHAPTGFGSLLLRRAWQHQQTAELSAPKVLSNAVVRGGREGGGFGSTIDLA